MQSNTARAGGLCSRRLFRPAPVATSIPKLMLKKVVNLGVGHDR